MEWIPDQIIYMINLKPLTTTMVYERNTLTTANMIKLKPLTTAMVYGKDTWMGIMTKLKPYNNYGLWKGHECPTWPN